MHTMFERLLSKSLTTLEVMTYYLVVHTGPGQAGRKQTTTAMIDCFAIRRRRLLLGAPP